MISPNALIKVHTRSAVADTGQVAVASPQTFRLIQTAEPGKTIRRNTLMGDYIVTQAPSKEIASGGKRTLLRFNLNSNGSDLPAASAYVVITTAPGTKGRDRGVEAFNALLSLIAYSAVLEESGATPVLDAVDGAPQFVINNATPADFDLSTSVPALISRILDGEG